MASMLWRNQKNRGLVRLRAGSSLVEGIFDMPHGGFLRMFTAYQQSHRNEEFQRYIRRQGKTHLEMRVCRESVQTPNSSKYQNPVQKLVGV